MIKASCLGLKWYISLHSFFFYTLYSQPKQQYITFVEKRYILDKKNPNKPKKKKLIKLWTELCIWRLIMKNCFWFYIAIYVYLSLTYAVAENDGQNHSYAYSNQGGAFPGAMFRGLLKLESPPGQAVSGQRTRRCGVNSPRCHGVPRGCCAKERCRPCARFKKKVPVEKQKQKKALLSQWFYLTQLSCGYLWQNGPRLLLVLCPVCLQ